MTSEGSESRRFTPEEIRAFGFTGGRIYRSAIVKSGKEERSVFLECLYDGRADLYYLKERSGLRYFLETQESKIIELTNNASTDNSTGIQYTRNSNKHVGVLKYAFSDCERIQSDIDRVSLSHNSLIRLFESYDKCFWSDKAVAGNRSEAPEKDLRFSPTLGSGVSSIRYYYMKELEGVDFNYSYTPHLGIRMNKALPRIHPNLDVLAEISLAHSSFDGSKFDTTSYANISWDTHISMVYLESDLSFQFCLKNTGPKPFIAIGLTIWANLYEDCWQLEERENNSGYVVEQLSEDLEIHSSFPGLVIRMGCKLLEISETEIYFNLKYRYYSKDTWVLMTRAQTFSLEIGAWF